MMRNSARIFVFMLVCIVMTGACMISFAGDAAGSDVPRFFALVIGNGKYLAEDMEPLLRECSDHAEDASVPCLRCFSNIGGNLCDLPVNAFKSRQIR